MNIFPSLKKGKWIEINLNEESKKASNDLSDADICLEFITSLHKERKADYSYGGFLEDRTYLWRNNPCEKADSLVHLGIDYSIPTKTKISLPLDGRVFHIMKDPNNNIGWGGRIIWEIENGNYLLYGHLNQNIKLRIGQECKKGEIVAVLGDKHENGNWWPHLHVQIMNKIFLDNYKGDLDKIDGYLPNGHKDIKNLISPDTLIKL